MLESACPPSLVRAVFEGEPTARDLWATLVELDWPGLGVAEEHGGLGLGFLEVGILVEELGRVVAPSPFLATVTQLAPLLREAGSSFLLADVAAGARTGTLAIAEDGRWRLDAVARHRPRHRGRLGARRREVARARRRDRRRDRGGRPGRRPGSARSSSPAPSVAATAPSR